MPCRHARVVRIAGNSRVSERKIACREFGKRVDMMLRVQMSPYFSLNKLQEPR